MFTKQQRSGIFLLLILIVSLQLIYHFVDFSSESFALNEAQMKQVQLELDSLRTAKVQEEPKIFPFNPNYITDYKGYTLGMSVKEIDRLHEFREQNKWVNSTREFQVVTKVSDSLLAEISPYFKFPEWVTNPKPSSRNTAIPSYANSPRTFDQKIDLNQATQVQLQNVNGIGEKLSQRIVDYKNRLGGFHADVEIKEVYGLSPEVVTRVLNMFTVKTPRSIKKININTATVEELVTVKYIDYEIAHDIIEQRTLREGFQKIEDLTKVKSFPVNKIEIIELYLTFD